MERYFNGDKVEMTGKTEIVYGGLFHEFIYLEGHKKGESGLMADRIFNLK